MGAQLSAGAKKVLDALRATSRDYEDIKPDDTRWAGIYLDNTDRPDGMTEHQFAGYLSALEKKKLYRQLDGRFFGEVLMEDDE